MSRISQVEYESASYNQKAQFNNQIQRNGRITNMKKTLLHSLPAFHALMEWYPLRDEVKKILNDREITFFCYAISSQNDCLICTTFFKKILDDLNIDFNNFDFTSKENLLISYGKALVCNPHKIENHIFEHLNHLFSEEQIVLLTSFGAIMIATNLINTALDVELDDYLLGYAGGIL